VKALKERQLSRVHAECMQMCMSHHHQEITKTAACHNGYQSVARGADCDVQYTPRPLLAGLAGDKTCNISEALEDILQHNSVPLPASNLRQHSSSTILQQDLSA